MLRAVLGAVVAAVTAARGSAAGAVVARRAPDPVDAARLFAEAQAICERDHGRLWGRSLCGPVLLVDYTDRAVLANQADGGGRLSRDGSLFRGVLPESVLIANTPTEWSGTRWAQIDGPAPADAAKRHVLLAHELFHRIQPALGLARPEVGNRHLDLLEGRYLLQLEWRALARALRATTAAERRTGVLDALTFRRARYRLYPDAAREEGALEINEGVPEYTGVRLGLATDRDRTAYAVSDLSAFVTAPTFVRSFAYATGPAYGLLLDRADPAWRRRLASGKRLDELLSAALHLETSGDTPAAGGPVAERAARYDDGTLRAAEVRRDQARRAQLAALTARLVDGPVLSLPLRASNYQFNPQTLIPLEGYGTVYPTMRLTDDWGALEVEHGGALVRAPVQGAAQRATVTAVGVDASGMAGDGWRLTLTPGWTIRPGARPGDLTVAKADDRRR